MDGWRDGLLCSFIACTIDSPAPPPVSRNTKEHRDARGAGGTRELKSTGGAHRHAIIDERFVVRVPRNAAREARTSHDRGQEHLTPWSLDQRYGT